jgi:ATP-binding cassette, subfamily F, member 3
MLQISNLSVHFGERYLFDGITFQIGEQERIGLAGRNGAGKSTLLKVLAGIHTGFEGQVQVPKEYSIGYLKQDLGHASTKTVREEAATAFDEVKYLHQRIEELTHAITDHHDYESDHYGHLVEELTHVSHRYELLDADKMDKKLEVVLIGLGFLRNDLDRPLRTFSGGWQMRVELAKLLLRQPDLLLLDEPTNHLDIESIMWLEQFLQDYPGSIVLVSHDKRLLDNLTKRTIEIELGKVYDYKANYSKYIELRAERREKLMAEKKNQDRVVKQTEQLINKFRAKASKAAFAQSLIKKLDKMDRVEIDDVDSAGMRLSAFPSRHVPAGWWQM